MLITLLCVFSSVLLLSYLLHVSQCDWLSLVATVGPALARVPSGSSHSGGRLSQTVEQRHLLSQAEGAEVRLLLTLALALALLLVLILTLDLVFNLHGGQRLGVMDLRSILDQPCLPRLLLGGCGGGGVLL